MTLRGVEQASRRFPEPIAFDYLARLERGALMPSVPKLATLANVYQRPLQDFIDLYELENLKALVTGQEGDFWHFRKLGIDFRVEGDHWRSAGAMLLGLDAARDSGDIDVIAQALTSVGVALNTLGRYHAAQRFCEEALCIVRNDRIRGYALHGVAQAYFNLGNLVLSEVITEKAAAFAEHDVRLGLYVRNLRAAILADRGRYEEAAEALIHVMNGYLEVGETENAIRAQYSRGSDLVLAGKVEEGLFVLRDSMARAAELGDPRLRAQSRLFYGRALYRAGRYQDAISPLKAAFLIARDREMPQQAFDSAFYLWKLSDERDSSLRSEEDWLDEARRYRPEVEQRSDEVQEFDAFLAAERRKPRPGRKAKYVM